MFTVNEKVLAELVKVLDWNDVITKLYAKDPAVVADLLNDVYQDVTEGEDDPGESGFDLWTAQRASKVGLRADLAMGLDRTFTHVARAVNTKIDGRVTTTDKITAIKELRGAFGLTPKDAKDEVERMMERYESDPCYYPKAESYGPGLGYRFS